MFTSAYCLTSFILVSIILSWTSVQSTHSHYTKSERHLIGVHPERRSFYEQLSDQNFTCLDGSRTILRESVNDDYCDCRDASDEPGTSACPHGRFYCSNEGYIQKLIPSAWINDGQCDCCDGSDEYDSNVTCENNCGTLGEIYRQEQEKNREIADKGAAIRSQYKEEAKQKKEQNSQLLEQYKREVSERESAIKRIEEEMNSDFGPSQVFLSLKGKCYNFRDREYTYTLCPFERASQDSSGMQTELGRWAGWAGPQDNPYSAQKYEGGMQCWNGPARSAFVNIACGVEDRITSVTEPAKCEYVFDFITPAACPDLDPPEALVGEGQPLEPDVESQTDVGDPLSQVEETQHSPETEDEPLDHGETHDEL